MTVRICLTMIVKNESKIIERCITACAPVIDAVCITDTGSVDNTVQKIECVCSDLKIPFKVYKEKWKNFGWNRSNSFLNTRNWITSTYSQQPLDSWYALFLDADMILECGDFNREKLSEHGYNILQYNKNLSYYNIRLARLDIEWKCVGPTHEVWMCDKECKNIDQLKICDIGDGGCKTEKFSRDIALLQEALQTEPDNSRYIFYLAQSYRDIGDVDNAIKYYLRRVSLGGWEEEVFISRLKLGDLFLIRGEDDAAIKTYITAYEYKPNRIETLYRLAKYYRLKSEYSTAMIYAITCKSTPYPDTDVLFIEDSVYNYLVDFEVSVSAYYTRYRELGLKIINRLIFDRSIPGDIYDLSRRNHYYYITQIPGKVSERIDFPVSEGYTISSTSILKSPKGHGFIACIRSVNYKITPEHRYIIQGRYSKISTENYLGFLDNNYNIRTLLPVKSVVDPINRDVDIYGLEDMRIFMLKNRLLFFATTFQYTRDPTIPGIVVGEIDLKTGNVIQVKQLQYNTQKCQKNWMPFCEGDQVYAIYSHEPTIILKIDIDTGKCLEYIVKRQKYNLAEFRGSSPPIRYYDDWLMIIHEVDFLDTRKYSHRFVIYDQEWNLKKISQSFYFESKFIEYVLSCQIQGDSIVIPYSVLDSCCNIKHVNLGELEKMWII